ncbi:MAG TPA: TonB-dependent receptor plug domain-containing protein, partial [Azonexus sp.]|nr:TonB-dependent receptor plug domain-containing protein [Azonexus sp.]
MYRKVNAVNAGPADWRPRTIALAIGLALAGPAIAQEAVPVMQEVLVTGQAASMDSALDVQQMADNIVSVVHADAIGQLPDSNAAEALQRIPGLSVERDQGEGRYVRVRGLGPELNSVTINGSLVPAPESDTRAVALDVLLAGLIRSLEVSKSLTPDQDANSIGGTIEVKTISAFDHKGMFYSLEGGASYDSNVEQTSPWFA